MMYLLFCAETGRTTGRDSSPAGSPRAGGMSRGSRPQSTVRPDLLAKRRVQRENMKEAAEELLAHFSHRNLDALLKVTRNTLEGMRKRITSSSMVHYISGELRSYIKP